MVPEEPSQSERVSGPGSWAAGNPFVGNAGPEFDPKQAEQPRATPIGVLEVAWQPDRIRTMLKAQGILTHDTVGVGREDWLWRASELDAVSEPLANTLNKIPVTRAAAAVSDELTVGAVMFNYATRSIKERARVIRAQKAADQQRRPPAPQPLTGVDGAGRRVHDPNSGDIEWEVPD